MRSLIKKATVLLSAILFLSFQSPIFHKTIAQDTSPTPEATSTPEVTPTPESTPDPESILPPSGGGEITIATAGLNNNFTGIWKARVKRPAPETSLRKLLAHIIDDSFGSSIITFKLCVKEGRLEGIVQQGGVFIKGVITSQTVISIDEVEFTAKSKDGRTAQIKLRLTGERSFVGTFIDGHTFEGRKLNPFRGCLAPGKGPKPGKPDKPDRPDRPDQPDRPE